MCDWSDGVPDPFVWDGGGESARIEASSGGDYAVYYGSGWEGEVVSAMMDREDAEGIVAWLTHYFGLKA